MGSGTLGTLALGGDSGPEARVLPSAVGIQLAELGQQMYWRGKLPKVEMVYF
jgi:hypothetical protein